MKGLYASMGQPGGASLNGAPAGSPSTHVTINGLLVPNTDYPSPTYDSAEHGHFKPCRMIGVPIYIEDEDGNVFTNGAYSELRLLIKRLFRDLVGHSLDSETWGSSGTHATRYVYSEVYKAFPVLAKCQAHFRLHVLLTRMYPDFTRLDVTKAAREAVKQENVDAAIPEGSTSSKKRQTASTSQARSSKRTKHTRKYPDQPAHS
ncbi:uncharacterized protein TRAVEDRAFT_43080 [Trametes versicolor FP-101664 SS1]|uniref:uncharacterized protein n=1 Tax=Trametes versicolor (strain FP-101664) TaxID=717944 RepID=UPI00046232C2|nr:uncharacterized protein TRAVEDRAFT_43080 [Trametes versicolor FP-101664 SS1]EIW62748.1 hypothetical protein TRAVEDRAFT_43080 [Trametes versicolor FP-101664 SS1]